MRTRSLFLCVAVVLWGCGDGVNDVDPQVVPGGGVTDGAIEGELNVHVIDSLDDAPISGALVLVGEPGETPLEGETDSAGLIVFEDGSLKGPQTITVVADGYVTATWFGANGANVTIPIDDTTPTASSIPQATLSGTINGWDDIPTPSDPSQSVIAFVSYSQSRELGDPANELSQGPDVFPQQNVCFKNSAIGTGECNWDLNTRAGNVAVFAIIAEFDNNGTPLDDTDDTSTITGFAQLLGLTVDDGADQTGLALDMVGTGDLADITVDVDPAPAGLTDTGVLIGIDTGDDGIMFVGIDFDEDLSFTVPDLVGAFAGMTYELVGIAGDMDSALDDQPGSAFIDRGITSSSTVTASPWLELAGGLDQTDGEFSYRPVDGAVIHTGAFLDSGGDHVWNVAILDGRTSFTLPAIDPDPLPASGVDMTLGAFDADINVRDFQLEGLGDVVNRLSLARANDIL